MVGLLACEIDGIDFVDMSVVWCGRISIVVVDVGREGILYIVWILSNTGTRTVLSPSIALELVEYSSVGSSVRQEDP